MTSWQMLQRYGVRVWLGYQREALAAKNELAGGKPRVVYRTRYPRSCWQCAKDNRWQILYGAFLAVVLAVALVATLP